jgi:hypothetical protein
MTDTFKRILRNCAILQIALGIFMFGFMLASFWNAEEVLLKLLGVQAGRMSSISANSWAQTAVAFGMHSYADIANGYEAFSHQKGAVAPVVTVWNSTRFLISFLWVLQFIGGLVHLHGLEHLNKWPIFAQIVVFLLLFDTLLLRPIMVFCQRKINDENPPLKNSESDEWGKLTLTQKVCRGVFYYEGIISGMSGCAYFLFPQLFLYLYFPGKYQIKETFDVAAWSLSQFGVNVMAFGLYQMNADIDSRTGHIVWWLILDIVWMYFYWVGVTSVLGEWNPWTFSGANFWCHAAFHADSTLAIARSVFLVTLWTSGRPKAKSL